MLKQKKILVGITGGIAAYKIPMLVRDLKKAGAEVRIVMTEAGREFVSPISLSTVSGNEVVVGNFPRIEMDTINTGTWHIDLAQWADVMLIAPATANTIAKIRYGIADNPVSVLALAMRAPVVISPSMDYDMWLRDVTQSNISALRERGYQVIPPDSGPLASGLTGPGRLPSLPKIKKVLETVLSSSHKDLSGKKILVTAGPTYEPIDPVRFLGNRSSGKMGFALAAAAAQRGAEVLLIAGPVKLQTPNNVKRIDITTAKQMYRAVIRHQDKMDAVIMAAAVSDFMPMTRHGQKIKKDAIKDRSFSIKLKKTDDILEYLGRSKKNKIIVGFAVETENEVRNATKKLKEKGVDLIILNNPLTKGAGFDVDTNIVSVISKEKPVERLNKMSKHEVAHAILDRMKKLV